MYIKSRVIVLTKDTYSYGDTMIPLYEKENPNETSKVLGTMNVLSPAWKVIYNVVGVKT